MSLGMPASRTARLPANGIILPLKTNPKATSCDAGHLEPNPQLLMQHLGEGGYTTHRWRGVILRNIPWAWPIVSMPLKLTGKGIWGSVPCTIPQINPSIKNSWVSFFFFLVREQYWLKSSENYLVCHLAYFPIKAYADWIFHLGTN